jgi:hypothetical protein
VDNNITVFSGDLTSVTGFWSVHAGVCMSITGSLGWIDYVFDYESPIEETVLVECVDRNKLPDIKTMYLTHQNIEK